MLRPTRHYSRQIFSLLFVVLLSLLPTAAATPRSPDLESGQAVYAAACAACHGPNGHGAPPGLLAIEAQVPDFTDCDFAAREPDSDWVGIGYEGGPSRGFSEFMPAFQGVLTVEQVQSAVDHIRTICTDRRWPRGELNLPRALVTNKAFPEDEALFSSLIDMESPGAIVNKFVYEQRFGPRSQWEVVIPFGWLETENVVADDGSTRWSSTMGDIAVAVKHDFYHDKDSIVAVAGELIFPTGDDELGFGNGTTVLEPFVAWGQILPADFFFQSQLGFELTADKDVAENSSFLRCALGWTTTTGQFGRAWSPMVELTGGREFASDATARFSVVPQAQITLNKRQHVMLNVGIRVPLNERDVRESQLMLYLLWDWFDGGFFEGW